MIVAFALAFVTSCATTDTPPPCEPEIKVVEVKVPVEVWPDLSGLVEPCIEPQVPPGVREWVETMQNPQVADGLTWFAKSLKVYRTCVAERDAILEEVDGTE